MFSLWSAGPKPLRDAMVFLLALCGAVPFMILCPRLLAGAAAGWLLLFFTPLPFRLLRSLAERSSSVPDEGRFIAVLGGGFSRDGRLSPRSVRRVRHGVQLAGARCAALVVCGGVASRERTEAQAMAALAREMGFAGPLVQEERSLSTIENLLALSQWALTTNGPKGTGALVTCPQHVPRIRRISREIAPGFHPLCYPAEHLPRTARDRLALAGECFYECAIHLWLTMRQAASVLGLCVPLREIRRPHLRPEADTRI